MLSGCQRLRGVRASRTFLGDFQQNGGVLLESLKALGGIKEYVAFGGVKIGDDCWCCGIVYHKRICSSTTR